MKDKLKVMTVVGTRPEIIRLSRVMAALDQSEAIEHIIVHTGQNYDYVVKSLTDFKAKTRTNDAGNMTSVASTLSAADIENLAHYIAGLN